MSDYDFKALNDKEFEILCADLISIKEGRKLERFKPGKDGGVDGRFFSSAGKEVVLQCKHWPDTDIKVLAKKLENDEKPKVKKLNPDRYILAVSKPLSRRDKTILKASFDPYIRCDTDILGKEDLNDILRANNEIERRHYKLWLHSTGVISNILHKAIYGRSQYYFDKILAESDKYFVTSNHNNALEKLDRLGAVVITGEPGIGKTMLADHLCLYYVANGYDFFKISDDVKEAENVFQEDQNQIFYFDDFLGRNYLEAVKGNEGSKVVHFFNRVSASKNNKKFILTSRSTILNQGKLLVDDFEHVNLRKNEYELRITDLTDLDKAHILYNHIWHSGLDYDYVEEIYREKRYRLIIKHKNFNPRLISYITDDSRLENVLPEGYWDYISQSLANPAQIWDNPFEAQQDDFGKAIVFLVVINGKPIDEASLGEAFARFIELPENHSMHGRRDFKTNIRTLVGSLLNRAIASNGKVSIDLFNPSIGDYVLNRYSGNVASIRQAIFSLYTLSSLRTLDSMESNGSLLSEQKVKILKALLHRIVQFALDGINSLFLSHLCRSIFLNSHLLKDKTVKSGLETAIEHLASKDDGFVNADTYKVMQYAYETAIVHGELVLKFLSKNFTNLVDDDEIQATTTLIKSLPKELDGLAKLEEDLLSHVIELASDSLEEFVDTTEAFYNTDYGDYIAAQDNLHKLLEKKFETLGLSASYSDINTAIDKFDVRQKYDKFFHDQNDRDDDDMRVSNASYELYIDPIDDLFDRSSNNINKSQC